MAIQSGVQFAISSLLQKKQQDRAEALARDRMAMEDRIQSAVQARLDEQLRENQRTALQFPMLSFGKDAEVAAATATPLQRGREAARALPTAPEETDAGMGVLAPDAPERSGMRWGKDALGGAVQGSLDEASGIAADIFGRRAKERAEQQAALLEIKRQLANKPHPYSFVLTEGTGGAKFLVDPRNPGAPAVPVPEPAKPGGAPGGQLKKVKPLSATETNAIQSLVGEQRVAEDLLSRFEDGFAGKGFGGDATVRGEQMLGSWATDDAQAEATYWADLKRLITLPQRHKEFGATLTPNEQAAWSAADLLSAKSDPAVVRETLGRMIGILKKKVRERGAASVLTGTPQDVIDALGAGSPVQLPADEAEADAMYEQLPSGAQFIGPDGIERTKP